MRTHEEVIYLLIVGLVVAGAVVYAVGADFWAEYRARRRDNGSEGP